jgi:hypothetical protein
MSHHRRLRSCNWTSFISKKWETEDCEVFELLDNMITNDTRCAHEITCRIAMPKKALFTSKFKFGE